MKTKIYKTEHFWQRAWERGINQSELDKLIRDLKPVKRKTLVVFGKNNLKKAGIKLKNKSHLIIVIKDNALITLFEVPNLFYYMKSHLKSNFLLF